MNWAMHNAVRAAVDTTVYWAMHDAVSRTVSRTLDWAGFGSSSWAVGDALYEAVSWPSHYCPPHPAIATFLTAVSAEAP